MSRADNIFVRGMMMLVIIEYFADQGQWTFQSAKALYQKTAKVPLGYTANDLDRGFVTSGLWAYSRHPNFAAEQAIWVALYQWGCYDTNVLYNWTFIGAISYLMLFQASTWFTELVTSGKYPDYKLYQKRTGKFLPKAKDIFALFTMTDEERKAEIEAKEREKAGVKEVGSKKVGVKRDARR